MEDEFRCSEGQRTSFVHDGFEDRSEQDEQ